MKRTSLLMMWLMLIGFSMANATEVVVGTQESNKLTNWFPTNPFNAYSLSQQIYTASDLGSTSGSITSISFYRDWTSESIDNLEMSGLKLYMKATSKSAFSSNTDMVPVDDDDLVWEGTFSAPTADYKGWITIELNEPFQYNPTANLLVCFYDANANKTPTNTNKFYYVPTSGNTAITYYSNDVVPDLNNINSFSGNRQVMSAHNYAKFNFANINVKTIEDKYTGYNLPTNTNWKYCLTEQIYTIAEIGGAQTINSLSFHADGARTRNLDIYLVPTDKEYFEDASDYLSYSNANKVFSGTVNFLANDWTTINLVIPYTYNGAKNLCLIIDDNTGNYDGGTAYFLAYKDSKNRALNARTDNIDLTYSNAVSESSSHELLSYKSKMRINGGPVIKDATTTLPTYTEWSYYISQQIYTVDELNYTANTIGSLSFFNTSEEQTRDIDIYLVHTDDNVFATSSNWVPFSESDKVFSGEVTFKSGEWTAIGLDRYFDYNGTSNLCVIVDDNTGRSESTGLQFLGCYAAGYAANAVGSHGTDYTPSMATTGSLTGGLESVKSQIKFNERGLNFKPRSITVSDITWDGAYVTWESRGNMWNIEYKRAWDDTWEPLSEDLEVNSYDLTGMLEQATTYDVRVQTNYKGELSGWATAQFTTEEHYARPSDIELVQVTPYTAIIKWKENGDATAWEIWLDNSSTDESATFQADHTTYVLADLTPNADYAVEVRSVIDAEAEEYSFWSYEYYFTTPDANPAPYGLNIAEVTPTSATLNWEGSSETYKIRYRKFVPDISTFFEDFESGDFNTNSWTVYTEGESPYTDGEGNYTDGWALTNNGIGTYAAAARSYNSGTAYNADNWLVSPLLQMQDLLKYYEYTTSSWPDSYEVLLSFTGNTVADFTSGNAVVLREMAPSTSGATWKESVIDLSAYKGDMGYIAFHHVDYDKYYLYIDNFGIYEETEKDPWQEIETKDKTTVIEGLDADTEYEVELYGTVPGQDYIEGGKTNFTTMIKNPAPYDFSVVAGATTADLSWTGYGQMYEVKYRTAQEAETFSDDFESGNFTAKGWTTIVNDASSPETDWQVYNYGSSNAHSGSYVACTSAWNTSTTTAINADNWLISPVVDLGGRLSYWRKCNSSNWPDYYEVLVSTTGNAIADFTDGLVYYETCSNTSWSDVCIDLSAYEGQQGYIAFHFSNYENEYLYLDDVSITSWVYGPWTTKYVTKPEIALKGLTANCTYNVQVTSQMSGEPDATSEVFTFTTKAADPIDLVFQHNGSNSSTIYANDGAFANVTINNLTLKSGEWTGITLPFDLDIENSVLANADLRTIESHGMTGPYYTLNCLTPLSYLQAGYPYYIKWNGTSDLVNPTFKGVTIVSATHNRYLSSVTFYASPLDYDAYTVSSDFPDVYGTSGDAATGLVPMMEGYQHKAFEPEVYVSVSLLPSSETPVVLNTGDNDLITGISLLKNETDNDVIYNVAGQRLSKTQKGINIVNGKKILVK